MGLHAIGSRRITACWLTVLSRVWICQVTVSCPVLAATAVCGVTGALASVLRQLLVCGAGLLRDLLVSEALHLMRRQHGGRQGQQQLQPVGVGPAEVVPADGKQ